MNKKIIRFLPVFITFITAGIVFCCSHKSVQEKNSPPELTGPDDIVEEADPAAAGSLETVEDKGCDEGVWVYICGAVASPGVYCLDRGSRLIEALDMAGGINDDASEESLNLASELTDGQKIYVPRQSETGMEGILTDKSVSDPSFTENDPGLVNINTAGKEELMTLPGIGESKAQSIISYREKNPFISKEDIMNVSGIKEGSYDKIKDLITV